MNDTDKSMDVKYVAHLARIYLTDEETARFQTQLNHILSYVNQLKTVNVDGIEPTAHAVPVSNVFRADEVRPSLDHDLVIANAPDSRHDQFSVPRIIE